MSDIVEQFEKRLSIVANNIRLREQLATIRAATIEECAQVNDMCALNTFTAEECQAALRYAAAAIRARAKEKQK